MLAMVDDGVSSVEREFLGDVVAPSGPTVAEVMVPRLPEIVAGRVRPALTAGPRGDPEP